jgi:hypothetical protein
MNIKGMTDANQHIVYSSDQGLIVGILDQSLFPSDGRYFCPKLS